MDFFKKKSAMLGIARWTSVLVILAVATTVSARVNAAAGTLQFDVTDNDGQPLPCRIHLQDAKGKPHHAPDLPHWADHFVCNGSVQLEVPEGKYHYEIERGPEYERHQGDVSVVAKDKTRLNVQLSRIADLAKQGWWSGEFHIHRSVDDIELLMKAEDLHVGTVITWWNDQNLWLKQALPEDPLRRFDTNRFCHVMAGEDEREGGALLYLNLARPLDIRGASREYPSPMKYVQQARLQENVWIDIEKIYWWDVPVWLASGQVDSVELASNHMWRNRMYESEAWGKPRDTKRLPPPLGTAFWTQEIYYHLLNCGLRIPPSAGTASGVHPNPVGYNRVYVYTGKPLEYADWWQALKQGRAMVTNGPLLLCDANGQLPGHVFISEGKQEVNLKIELTSNDPVSAVEIIHNGEIVQRVTCDPESRSQKLSVTVTFDQSGWFLLRAIADNKRTFRFASTAPYFLEVGDSKKFVSRRSAQFFLDWVRERMGRIKLEDEKQRREVLVFQERALKFWQEKLAAATAE